ncbi:threonine dehydratase [Anaerovirgula multivorans]|uniref:threonine ammonia-lyase n=1 Tax=Anaerovirgula multivorans TaxID=312168 RepID=A0A239DH26_9FIRM|nr:pyridoxal-phosphate dependent enzyme [Anaerovirgula multivorans]SNS31138.1 threonine dehydratase [Anaerovirgula multivorans]
MIAGKNEYPISLKEVLRAEQLVYKLIKPTPLVNYKSLSDAVGADIYIKHENHLPGGSFKIRGGLNIMYHLKQQKVKGVITFSTGNHGISIATAAKVYGIEATVVVPKGNNPEKNQRIKDAGAILVEAGDNFEQAAHAGMQIQKERDLYYIHAANEPHLINGVGTEFIEILRELPDIDAIILPIGGGSELAAAVTVFKSINPEIEIYAVQAEASKAAYLSWKTGKIIQSSNQTFAGGFATGAAYEIPFGIYKNQLTDFILLSEDEIRKGIYLALYHTHNLAEGAGASTIIAAQKISQRLNGKKVVLQMSGCNETMSSVRDSLKTCKC